MNVTSISFSKLYNLGNYNNERFEVTLELHEWDAVTDAFRVAQAHVQAAYEAAHPKEAVVEEEDIPF